MNRGFAVTQHANTNVIKNCNLYNRLRVQYEKEGYKAVNADELSCRISSLIKMLPPDQGKKLSKTIYVLVMHHERLSGAIYREVAYGGTKITKECGVSIAMSKIPPHIHQLLRIFIDQFIHDECPEQHVQHLIQPHPQHQPPLIQGLQPRQAQPPLIQNLQPHPQQTQNLQPQLAENQNYMVNHPPQWNK